MEASFSDSRFLERRLERTSLGRATGRGTLATWAVHGEQRGRRPLAAPALPRTVKVPGPLLPLVDPTPADLRLGA